MPMIFMALVIGLSPVAAAAPEKTVVLDVRTPAEYERSHIRGARHIDLQSSDYFERIKALDRSMSYKVYCKAGGRAEKATLLMKSLGFKKVENLGALNEAATSLQMTCEGQRTDCQP